jgi:hypothetical protein
MHEEGRGTEYAISTRARQIALACTRMEQMETEEKNEHSNGRMHV